MERGTCSCTALTFTRNSAETLERCLQSGLFCAEHVILDGGSTDGTLELAKKYGCRVVQQDKQFLNQEGRIIDYGNMRNQGVREARYPWTLMIDSDEYIDHEATLAVQRIVEEEPPGAYNVHRLYTDGDHLIKYASTYPNYQIRLFHKEAITRFIKIVHERPEIRPGLIVQVLPGIQYVPLTPLPDLRKKFGRYIQLELEQIGHIGYAQWIRLVVDKHIRLGVRAYRVLRDRLLHRWSDCLPLRYELLYSWYTLVILWRTFPLLRERKYPSLEGGD